MADPRPARAISRLTAMFLVVATMIGTGVFTTTGYLLRDIGSPLGVLFAWLVGGATALFGALAYAELVAAIPTNGGEYRLMARIYGERTGFMTAWASLVVGFAAPMAASSVAFESYAYAALGHAPLPRGVLAAGLVVALSMLHAVSREGAERFQNWFTLGKVVLIVGIILGGAAAGDWNRLVAADAAARAPLGEALLSPKFAVGLIFVSYAYSGWNAAAYVAGEVRDGARSLPFAIGWGTGLVTLLYVALTAAFLMATDAGALMAGEERVGHVAAVALFGPWAGRGLSAVIALGLVSAVGALIATGPFVYASVGEDYPRLRVFALRRAGGGPVASIALQSVLALLMIASAQYDAILLYAGFTLSLVAAMTVTGVFVLRRREPDLARPYRTWAHPWSTALFLALSAWMILYAVADVPLSAAVGLATLGAGLLLHRFAGPRRRHGPLASAGARPTTD